MGPSHLISNDCLHHTSNGSCCPLASDTHSLSVETSLAHQAEHRITSRNQIFCEFLDAKKKTSLQSMGCNDDIQMMSSKLTASSSSA